MRSGGLGVRGAASLRTRRAAETRFKEVKREAYDQAIRELFHNRERLALIRAGDERQYALALEIWQVESHHSSRGPAHGGGQAIS